MERWKRRSVMKGGGVSTKAGWDKEERESAREEKAREVITRRNDKEDYHSAAYHFVPYLGVLHLRRVEGVWEYDWTEEEDESLAAY